MFKRQTLSFTDNFFENQRSSTRYFLLKALLTFKTISEDEGGGFYLTYKSIAKKLTNAELLGYVNICSKVDINDNYLS